MDGSRLRVSVVVPASRAGTIERVLAALDRQAFPAERYDVIVADYSPRRETRVIVDRVAARSPVVMRHVPVLVRRSAAAARNVGWRLTTGDVVAFTDDAAVPHPGWLQGIARAADAGADAGWGVTIVPVHEPPTDHERDERSLEHAGFTATNAFCRREVLDDLGGFDERYPLRWGDDRDLFFRLLERGYRVEHVPESIVVRPVSPPSLRATLMAARQREWDVLLEREHRPLYARHAHAAFPRTHVAAAGAMAIAIAGIVLRRRQVAVAGAVGWGALTAMLVMRRLRGAAHAPSEIVDAVAKSVLLPPLSVLWRTKGLVRHGSAVA